MYHFLACNHTCNLCAHSTWSPRGLPRRQLSQRWCYIFASFKKNKCTAFDLWQIQFLVRWYFALNCSGVVRCGIYIYIYICIYIYIYVERHPGQWWGGPCLRKGVGGPCPPKHALGPVFFLSRGHHGPSEARGTLWCPRPLASSVLLSFLICLVVLMFFESKVLPRLMAAMIVWYVCVRRSSGWLPSVLRQLFVNRLFASMYTYFFCLLLYTC
jgi:hypothetical protein